MAAERAQTHPARKCVLFYDLDDTITRTSEHPVTTDLLRGIAAIPAGLFIDGALKSIHRAKELGFKACLISHSYDGYANITRNTLWA